jgi:hypothetical protein
MRLLLDESVPRRLRNALPAHTVRTAVEMGWGGIKNGALLALAAPEFDAFITVDKNLPYQQNVAALPAPRRPSRAINRATVHLSIDFATPVPSPESPDIALDLSQAVKSITEAPLPLIRFAPIRWKEGYT